MRRTAKQKQDNIRKKGERGATYASRTRAGKIKTPRHGDTMESVTAGAWQTRKDMWLQWESRGSRSQKRAKKKKIKEAGVIEVDGGLTQ